MVGKNAWGFLDTYLQQVNNQRQTPPPFPEKAWKAVYNHMDSNEV